MLAQVPAPLALHVFVDCYECIDEFENVRFPKPTRKRETTSELRARLGENQMRTCELPASRTRFVSIYRNSKAGIRDAETTAARPRIRSECGEGLVVVSFLSFAGT